MSLFSGNGNPKKLEDRIANEDDPSNGILSPERIDKIEDKYVVITFGHGYYDGIRRINMMAERGWRCINIFSWGDELHALMEKA